MNFEPQKFFIGLVDFFSILMPGAMLTYLDKDWIAMKLSLESGFSLDSVEMGFVFFVVSYLLGHFIFLVSSLLDEVIYNPLRDCTDWGQIDKRLAKGEHLSARWKRLLVKKKWLFGKDPDNAVMQVQCIKARALKGLGAESAINAFHWCKARLIKDLPEGLLVVQHFEAASKFFRSFVVVLGILALFYFSQDNWIAATLCMVGIVPAMWPYINQRFKATQQAYWFVITLKALKTSSSDRIPRSDGLTHAGGVVYRRKGDIEEYLLVHPSSDGKQWGFLKNFLSDQTKLVLPKGHIEPGENPRVTAVREVRDETGHWARITHWLEDSRLGNKASAPMVRWFLMELEEEAKDWPEENRQRRWLPFTKAMQQDLYPETQSLLIAAEQKIKTKKAQAES
ncbi:MAG: NUDIX domain-containing protein [Nitrosomonas sp.]|jgi:8-oxo-dGTP pyrophosphatase MutT (NUDIX family)|uniref:NUDIX domain-containing protein n=1 Tax=Nitrosomonas ureae TaxID=44577 RepID=UPI000D7640FB|nr:NUDIX domain-containing protein [Nitrosomonas ureae]MBP9871788.1 NUDIX domain-containing protein [Nitrosomonas sp.]PXX16104.1 8-oxo-dGTP pyrophosphatase MutT (NUDIX family) [Nitrosomonas ureae]